MNEQDFKVTAVVRIEGKFPAKYRETAENEIESMIRGRLKNLPSCFQIIEVGTTATTRIL